MVEEKTKKKASLKERFDFSDWDKKTWAMVILFLVIMAATVVVGYMWMRNKNIFYEWILIYIILPLNNAGFWGILLFLVFMAIQSLLMPIPSEIVLLAGGIIYGLWGGFVIGMIGSLLSASLCYFIAANGGGPVVEKFLGKEKIEIVDVYLQKYGPEFVFFMRAVPFIGFDPISYVSGLVKIDFKKYFLANVVGCITRCVFWAWLGTIIVPNATILGEMLLAENWTNPAYWPADKFPEWSVALAGTWESADDAFNFIIESGAGDFNTIVLIILGTLIGFAILYNWVLIPYLKKRRDKEIAEMSQEEREEFEKKLIEKEASDAISETDESQIKTMD